MIKKYFITKATVLVCLIVAAEGYAINWLFSSLILYKLVFCSNETWYWHWIPVKNQATLSNPRLHLPFLSLKGKILKSCPFIKYRVSTNFGTASCLDFTVNWHSCSWHWDNVSHLWPNLLRQRSRSTSKPKFMSVLFWFKNKKTQYWYRDDVNKIFVTLVTALNWTKIECLFYLFDASTIMTLWKQLQTS